jgi:Ni,Fe-hydrogenase maturation factor
MKILVFGNPLLQKDNLALKLIPRLRKEFSGNKEIDFVESDSTEDLHKQGKNLIILDVAMDIKEVEIIEDLNRLATGKVYTMHDFDLSYNLKIFQKLKLIDSVKIIAIPQEMEADEAFDQLQLILKKWVAQDMQGS